MFRDAIFSKDKVYRYKLIRQWDKSKEKIIFIMLNPSTADHLKDDPTITRCIHFAKDWGYGALDILNLFAYRTPYPKALYRAKDPIGPKNIYYINKALKTNTKVVCAWGNLKKFKEEEARFLNKYSDKKLYFIKKNKSGSPAHPLYLPASSKLIRF